MSFDKRVRHLAQGLQGRGEMPSAELRGRILDTLPQAPDPVTKGKPLMLTRIALASAVVGAIVVGLITMPRATIKPALAAEVQAAVTRANTWHLSGWRLKNGAQVRWEAWGRRTPYFYREQIGEEVFLDNGRTRTHILPATQDANGFRHAHQNGHPGAVLVHPSVAQNISLTDPKAGYLVGIGGEVETLKPISASVLEGRTRYLGQIVTEEIARLTIDPKTRLPLRYTVEHAEFKPEGNPRKELNFDRLTPLRTYAAAQLTAAYDIPLPADIERLTVPQGYAVADMTVTCQDPEAQGADTATSQGLTVKASVAAQDAQGNMLLRFQGWMGNQPVNFRVIPVMLDINPSPSKRLGKDETDRPYFCFSGTGSYDPIRPEVWLAPAEPYTPNTQRPRQLTLNMTIQLSSTEDVGSGGRSVPVVTAPMTFTVALPEAPTPLDYDAPRRWGSHVGDHHSMAFTIAHNRAAFYIQSPAVKDERPGERLERAAYWNDRAAEEAERQGNAQWAKISRQNAERLRSHIPKP